MTFSNLFGAPPPELADFTPDARQFSPFSPSADDLTALPPGTLDNLAMLAPPGPSSAAVRWASPFARSRRARPFSSWPPRTRAAAVSPRSGGAWRPSHENAKRHDGISVAAAQGSAAIKAAIRAGAPPMLQIVGTVDPAGRVLLG